MDWLPIESAPRDGTEILGTFEFDPGQWDYRVIRWDGSRWDDGECDHFLGLLGVPVTLWAKITTPFSG